MTFKPGRRFYFILILCTLLWNQQASFLKQKIDLENSYSDKVASAVSRLLGHENFIVIVNVDVSETKSGQSSSNNYTKILPFPLYGEESDNMRGRGRMGENNYLTDRVKVNIELIEELVADTSIKEEIKSLVKKVIPEISECKDCIKIGGLGFPQSKEIQDFQSKKSTSIENLKKEIDKLKGAQRRAEEDSLKKELADVENRLEKIKAAKKAVDSIKQSRDTELARRDSLEYERLIKFEKSRHIQDSIRNDKIEEELNRVRSNKMAEDSILLSKTMDTLYSMSAKALDILDKQSDSNEDNEESILGMQVGDGGSSIMSSVIFILLIICLMIIIFLVASNKKPKPIYLKPKSKKIKTKTTENSTDINKGNADNTSSEQPIPVLQHDEDAIQSELRSLRQTAVSLTVGEKENASALIKEWLEDNPNKGDNPVED